MLRLSRYSTLQYPIPFLMGLGLAFLPAYAPFVGLFVLVGVHWKLERRDLLWWLAALLLGLPLAFQHGLIGALFGVLQILAPWLIYRAFKAMPRLRVSRVRVRQLGWGLVTGLALVVLLALFQVQQLNFDTAKTIAQAIVWGSNPNLYGHTVLALGGLIALLMPQLGLRLGGLGLAAFGILLVGSREAALGWVIVALVFLLLRFHRSRRMHILEITLLCVMVAMTAGLGPYLGWGRVGFLVDLVPADNGTQNLVQGSEIAYGDWWDAMGVEVSSGSGIINGTRLTTYEVSKQQPEGWRRLQQVVRLRPDTPYTVSMWLKRDNQDTRPGFQGWGYSSDSGEETWTITGVLEGEDTWRVSQSGAGRVLDAGGIAERDGDWLRVWATVMHEGGEGTLDWWLGLTPDQRQGIGAATTFAGFQLETGESLNDYVPGSATRGLSLGVARVPFWRTAWRGVLERPWLGWGQDRFAGYYASVWPGVTRLHEYPAHPHNLYLHVLFGRGLTGFIGLLCLLVALVGVAWHQRDLAFLSVLGVVLLVNLFDTTLFTGGIIYPLAAVAGWRAQTFRRTRSAPRDLSRELGVGLGLPLGDYLAAALSLPLAYMTYSALQQSLGLPPFTWTLSETWSRLSYLLLLWPAMYWREGLYPGYGLNVPQQLERQIKGALYAGLLLAAIALLLSSALPLSRGVLLLMVGYSAVLAPVGRAVSKRVLHGLGVWGRPVIVLGAGELGQSVAQALQERPLAGLQPVAFFDDDERKRGLELVGLRVRGGIDQAPRYARRRGISHAIVTRPGLSHDILLRMWGGEGRRFKRIQFVPDLGELPSSEVAAGSVGEMLALEVRNNLGSTTNQFFKRGLDLLGAVFGGLLISPVLVLLCILVYIDSPGPILFKQQRVSKGGKRFLTWKFRTMAMDAEKVLQDYLTKHPKAKEEWERNFKLKVDPRITRMGRILRKMSLDELPQLFNVLMGDMSLVGPRPLPEYHHQALSDSARAIREMVRPGMTGQWQITSRSDGDLSDLERYDTYYVRNWSVWLDLHILIETVAVVVKGKGAY